MAFPSVDSRVASTSGSILLRATTMTTRRHRRDGPWGDNHFRASLTGIPALACVLAHAGARVQVLAEPASRKSSDVVTRGARAGVGELIGPERGRLLARRHDVLVEEDLGVVEEAQALVQESPAETTRIVVMADPPPELLLTASGGEPGGSAEDAVLPAAEIAYAMRRGVRRYGGDDGEAVRDGTEARL